ncbi:MAG: hypothetical protein GX366_03605 [Epulopiscium sp.]|nr:hypothetical protein [Candidatus Epulonipiscium sp.]
MENVNSQQVIIALIFVCVLMLIWSVWRKQLLTVFLKVVVGMGIVWLINLLFLFIAIGLNGITAGTIAILGLPGIVMLYIINALL